METGNLARTLRTNYAGEYESAWFTKYLKDKGIHQEFSAPHCQSQNGLAEHVIGTLSDMANCMLVESGLQRKYWGYAVKYAAKVSNVTPTSALNGLMPYEMYYGRPPKNTMYHTFGCLCFRQVPKDQHKKFTPKSECCLFLGLSDNHEAFIVLRLDDSPCDDITRCQFYWQFLPSYLKVYFCFWWWWWWWRWWPWRWSWCFHFWF